MPDNNPQPENAHASQDAIAQARADLMTGRGRGASDAEVFSHQRGKLVQGGEPVVQRLAETARDAAHAHSGMDSNFVDGGLVLSDEQSQDGKSQPCADATTTAHNQFAWAGEHGRDRLTMIGAAFVMTCLFLIQRKRRNRPRDEHLRGV